MAKKAKKGLVSATKTSVLKRQKPKQSPKKKRMLILRRFLYVIAVLIVFSAVGAFYYGGQHLTDLATRWLAQPTTWNVSLKLEGDRPLDDKAAAAIIATAQRSLGGGSSADLQKTAQLVQKLAAFSTVHFLRVAPDRIIISLKQRFPVMCIDADKIRFIATDGTLKAYETAVVYGEVEDLSLCKGLVLTGVFEHGKKVNFHEDATVAMEAEDKEAVQEAVELLEETSAAKFEVKAIEYRNFRGFFVFMKDNETEVSLGRAPFTDKLEKLSELLNKLSKKGEVASRIELDYQGKAFIKLKKM